MKKQVKPTKKSYLELFKTKSDMGYIISMFEPYNACALYWNHYTKNEVKQEFINVLDRKFNNN